MAVAHFMSAPPARQGTGLALQMDRCLMVLNVTETLPVLSSAIMADAAEGEPYEVLVRRLANLHQQIAALAALAAEAKVVRL